MAAGIKTGGRKAGVPNKATQEIKILAQEFGPAAIGKLAQLAGLTDDPPAETEACQLGAMRELLDRAYGKAPQAITGADGGPLAHTYVVRAPTPVESTAEWLRLHTPSDSRKPTITVDS